MEFRELVWFLNGRLGDWAEIATVPAELCAHLGVQTNSLRIELTYARKLRLKHGLRPEHFHQIQLAINYGWAGLHARDLVFLYEDRTIFGTPFKLAIKPAINSELWLKTFHKIGPADLRSKLRQIRVLRAHSR